MKVNLGLLPPLEEETEKIKIGRWTRGEYHRSRAERDLDQFLEIHKLWTK